MAIRSCPALLFLLSFAACKATATDPKSVRLEVSGQGENCLATLAGKSFDPRDEIALRAALKPYIGSKTDIKIVGGVAVPYRCIGGAIYALQREGHQKIGFIAEPSEEMP